MSEDGGMRAGVARGRIAARSLAIAFGMLVLGVSTWGALGASDRAAAQSFSRRHANVVDASTERSSLGRAAWRVGATIKKDGRDGEPAWLMIDRPLQDVALFSRFRCVTTCEVGVLLRAEKTAAGYRGVYLAFTPNAAGAYDVEIDSSGAFLKKIAAPRAPSMLRIAPEARNSPGAPTESAGAPRPPETTLTLPVAAPDRVFRPGVWNSLEALLDANIVRGILNDDRTVAAGIVGDSGFGAIALYAASKGVVEFSDVVFADIAARSEPSEYVAPRFDIQRVNPFMYSWGVAVADINKDGEDDIVAGPNYFLGPDFQMRRELALSETYSPSTDSPVFQVELANDFTGDGWPDVLDLSLNRPGKLYVNPQGQSRRWTMVEVLPRIGGELALLTDLDRDGKQEVVLYLNRALQIATPGADATKPWIIRPISPAGAWGQHGMGVGDINGDGRLDVIQAQGWFEQPSNAAAGLWAFHPTAFSVGGRVAIGGAEMAVFDVNGDGLNDVVTALQAHNTGLSWFEQKRGADGAITFVHHPIMKGVQDRDNAGGVVFSQLHGAASADVDRDGIADFIVGKRHWSHHEGTTDPGADGPAVLYWYRTVKNARAPGGAEFVPELIHNRSGAGSQIVTRDLNRDGFVDIVTTGDHGTFIFWGKK